MTRYDAMTMKDLIPQKKHSYFQGSIRRKPAQIRIVHGQLRDLIVCSEYEPDTVWTLSGDARSIDRHDFKAGSSTVTKMPFMANCLVSGCGLLGAGSEGSDFLARSSRFGPRWSVKLNDRSCIVNSACFYQSDGASCAQALLCTNGYGISQYCIESLSNVRQSASGSLSVDPAHRPATPPTSTASPSAKPPPLNEEHDPYEAPRFLETGKLRLPVPVNHCSVSPDGSKMVAVGDSNEVFTFSSVARGGASTEWRCTDTDRVSATSMNVGSFCTAWNRRGTTYAVASEGNCLAIYDVRYSGCGGGGSTSDGRNKGHEIAIVKSVAQQYAGAMRTVKFSPGITTELLAFAEHQRYIHIMDALTLDVDTQDILVVSNSKPVCKERLYCLTGSETSPSHRTGETLRSILARVPEPQSGRRQQGSSDVTIRSSRPISQSLMDVLIGAGWHASRQGHQNEINGSLTSNYSNNTTTSHTQFTHARSASSPAAATSPSSSSTSSTSSASSSSSSSSISPSSGLLASFSSPTITSVLSTSPLSSTSMMLRPMMDRCNVDDDDDTDLSWLEEWRDPCDITGLSWSPDGETLLSGTEYELMEWKVNSCQRRSFGHAALLL